MRVQRRAGPPAHLYNGATHPSMAAARRLIRFPNLFRGSAGRLARTRYPKRTLRRLLSCYEDNIKARLFYAGLAAIPFGTLTRLALGFLPYSKNWFLHGLIWWVLGSLILEVKAIFFSERSILRRQIGKEQFDTHVEPLLIGLLEVRQAAQSTMDRLQRYYRDKILVPPADNREKKGDTALADLTEILIAQAARDLLRSTKEGSGTPQPKQEDPERKLKDDILIKISRFIADAKAAEINIEKDLEEILLGSFQQEAIERRLEEIGVLLEFDERKSYSGFFVRYGIL